MFNCASILTRCPLQVLIFLLAIWIPFLLDSFLFSWNIALIILFFSKVGDQPFKSLHYQKWFYFVLTLKWCAFIIEKMVFEMIFQSASNVLWSI